MIGSNPINKLPAIRTYIKLGYDGMPINGNGIPNRLSRNSWFSFPIIRKVGKPQLIFFTRYRSPYPYELSSSRASNRYRNIVNRKWF